MRKLLQSFAGRLRGRTAVVVLAVLVVVVVVFVLPVVMVRPRGRITSVERLTAENDIRTTLIQALGGAALLSGVYFTARTFRLNARTLEISREGQITERFTRAIDQLGDDKLDVRLGGIYALERIARDSEQDHGPIMEVLTAFVREHARWTGDASSPRDVSADIQAVATVLARRPEDRRREEDKQLDLSAVDLQGVNLEDGHLEAAVLNGAHLEGAYLNRAHLERAFLDKAHLEGAWLIKTHLERAWLHGAHLEGADLNGAHLERADLFDAHLEGARLVGAHLEGALLIEAHLEGAVLNGAHLEGAYLNMAHLEGARLDGASGLVRAQLERAITDAATVLPELPDEA